MNLFISLVALIASFSASALAQQISCKATGAGGAANCATLISTFCGDVSQNQFDNGDVGSRCFNTNGMNCVFNASNVLTTGSGTPNLDNCENVLLDISTSCDHGGKGKAQSTSEFSFSLQPNNGPCF
ncbi:hypothetical protein BDQ17DRAFT_857744 [Cyathus striatus]|nr:hypothetical protein BDQ17DRAFT_857744 [Cyathus striatus]